MKEDIVKDHIESIISGNELAIDAVEEIMDLLTETDIENIYERISVNILIN